MTKAEEKLDNPAWHSLTETHYKFAIKYDKFKFYNPDYCSFGGFTDLDKTITGIEEYSKQTNNFYVVGVKPNFNNRINLNNELVCHQMVLKEPIQLHIEETITKLEEGHKKALFDLINLVQPGYFKKKTFKIGNYYGIFKKNRLIAVAGERMKMNSFTEVSAIVTHPMHTGKGYARQLIAYATHKIFSENKTPYLHVAENNLRAIQLYEKLGFRTRRKISFWNLERSTT